MPIITSSGKVVSSTSQHVSDAHNTSDMPIDNRNAKAQARIFERKKKKAEKARKKHQMGVQGDGLSFSVGKSLMVKSNKSLANNNNQEDDEEFNYDGKNGGGPKNNHQNNVGDRTYYRLDFCAKDGHNVRNQPSFNCTFS